MPDRMQVAYQPQLGMLFRLCQGRESCWVIRVDDIEAMDKSVWWSYSWCSKTIEDTEREGWYINRAPDPYDYWVEQLVLHENVTEVKILNGEEEIVWEV